MMMKKRILTRLILTGLLAGTMASTVGAAEPNWIFAGSSSEKTIDYDLTLSSVDFPNLYANGGGKILLNGTTFSFTCTPTAASKFNNAYGIYAQNGGKIKFNNASSVTVNVNKNIKLSSDDNWVAGAASFHSENGTSGAYVEINADTLDITATSNQSDDQVAGVLVQNSTTSTSPSASTYDSSDGAATMIINAKTTNITATNTANTVKAYGIAAFTEGKLEVHSNLHVEATNAIMARTTGTEISINTADSDTDNYTQLVGDIAYTVNTSDANPTINVQLNGENSYWKGNTTSLVLDGTTGDTSTAGTNTTIGLNNGAIWTPTYVESVSDGSVADVTSKQYVALNTLEMNNGVINLDSSLLGDTQTTVNTIGGSGTGTVKTDSVDNSITLSNIASDTTLSLDVEGTSAMTDQINNGDTALLSKLGAVVKTTDSSKANADGSSIIKKVRTLASTINGAVEADYNSATGTASNVVMHENSSNRAISNSAVISLMSWRQENNDMNKRLGELRNSQGEHGAWFRMMRGRTEYNNNSNLTNQYNYYQLGYDQKVGSGWTFGGALTYTEGSSAFDGGNAENTHTGFAIYGSRLNNDGSFIDLIAKATHMKDEFKASGGVGNGDLSMEGYSLSAECGKRIQLNHKGLWFEPQAELTYGRVGSADCYTTNGAYVNQDVATSLVGRLGFALGTDFKRGNAYVRASYLHDFDGDTSITMSTSSASHTFTQELGGNWWEVGVGTNLKIGQDAHLYFDLEKTFDGTVTTPWQWNAGIRIGF